MKIEEYIDKFLLLISDPRNISPEEFAEYYPKKGEKYNSKKLDKEEIEKHFGSLQRFRISEDWNGYKSLIAEIYLLLESFEEQSKRDKKIALNYFVLKAKNQNLKTQSFIEEKLLSKSEYYNLLGAYMVFYNNLNSLIINDFKESIAEHKDIIEQAPKKSSNIKDQVKFKIGVLYAMGKMEKYMKNGRKDPNWSAPKIEKEINIPKSREYILGTLNNYDNSSNNHTKNVFNSIEHVNAILKHCAENNIEVCDSFLKRHKLLQQKNT